MQALLGFRVDAPVGFFIELNPGLVVLRQPPPGFEEIPFGELLFLTRINIGANIRL